VVAAGQCPQCLGPGNGHKAIGDRQAPGLGPLQPRIGSPVLALGTVAVCAGVIALLGVLAALPERDVTAQRCCPAVFDRRHGLPLAGPHWVCEFSPRRGPMQAEARCALGPQRASMRRLMAALAIS
jgi:hypothetical protein